MNGSSDPVSPSQIHATPVSFSFGITVFRRSLPSGACFFRYFPESRRTHICELGHPCSTCQMETRYGAGTDRYRKTSHDLLPSHKGFQRKPSPCWFSQNDPIGNHAIMLDAKPATAFRKSPCWTSSAMKRIHFSSCYITAFTVIGWEPPRFRDEALETKSMYRFPSTSVTMSPSTVPTAIGKYSRCCLEAITAASRRSNSMDFWGFILFTFSNSKTYCSNPWSLARFSMLLS